MMIIIIVVVVLPIIEIIPSVIILGISINIRNNRGVFILRKWIQFMPSIIFLDLLIFPDSFFLENLTTNWVLFFPSDGRVDENDVEVDDRCSRGRRGLTLYN